jgi:hypothetical protein
MRQVSADIRIVAHPDRCLLTARIACFSILFFFTAKSASERGLCCKVPRGCSRNCRDPEGMTLKKNNEKQAIA